MNDLSFAVASDRRRWFGPVPAAVIRVVVPLLLAALAFAVFILVVVHNAVLLVSVLVLSALILAFFLWNAAAYRRKLSLDLFLDRFPDTDLLSAKDSQLVKVTGRMATDFYITDVKSGLRALVKAGQGSKVIPLIEENILVNITSLNRELSSTLKKWLQGRRLSCEARLLRLEEGYVIEGTCLTVMGMLSRKNGVLVIVPLPETISTDCLLQKFLLPVDIDGLLLKTANMSTANIRLS
uniref:Uncharacterized protein n=1 Tax=Musa acuminata subsp. malaccensis TaxID=214687 RepID=A0A804J7A7_MUSAM